MTTGAPELKNLDDVTDTYDKKFSLSATIKAGKVIYIGVYGGELAHWPHAEGFDSQQWAPYEKIDSFNNRNLNDLAFNESILNVIGLRVARQFPNSVTFIIRGDYLVVADTVKRYYSEGDRIYLTGFSNGGSAIIDAAQLLMKQNIPVQMTAQIDSIGSGDIVPRNVSRAFNFHSTGDPICSGKKKMLAEDPSSTQVTNQVIQNPKGPFTWGFCTVHRNMDSEPRVWKAILGYIIKSESALKRSTSLRTKR